jgi:hypothetical protein
MASARMERAFVRRAGMANTVRCVSISFRIFFPYFDYDDLQKLPHSFCEREIYRKIPFQNENIFSFQLREN